jgi:FAD/FMN-containing dehydrogenase/Fe-S oxidoreductase
MTFNADELEAALKKEIEGEVRFDQLTKKIYSVDASIFEIEPIGVVLPKNREEIIACVRIAKDFQVPVIARGAATGIAGGCIGKGLIIDTSKYCNRILTIDYEQKSATVEPGVVQDQLNGVLKPGGYRLGPDTSTGNRATLGGMTANNSAGSRSLRYGKMVDSVEAVEMVLADGEVIEFGPAELAEKNSLDTREGEIYRKIEEIKHTYASEIIERFPNIPRRVSGYNLDELLKPGPVNLAKLITGSEGTLGVITKITVKISEQPLLEGQCLIFFNDLIEAMNHIPVILTWKLISLEMVDEQIIDMGRSSPSLRGKLGWLIHNPEVLFIAEFEANSEQELAFKLNAFEVFLKSKEIGYATLCLNDPQLMQEVRELRKSGLGLLLSKRAYTRAIAFIEDISIPPEKLASFFSKFLIYLQLQGKTAGIYGHVGSGCMHIRPFMNLKEPDEIILLKQMMNFVSTLVLEHGGAMSGEHGDGLLRSYLNEKMFGEKIYQAFLEVKGVFDPENRMNPGKIVNGEFNSRNFRLKPETKTTEIKTFQNFAKEGGFELSVDLCNGNGLCRKKEKIMCPSFQATQDEYHTTRARAQSLRALIHGELKETTLTSPEIHDVLDLCLSCKGCKTECPSQVDMAKIKAEFLYHYQEKRGYSLRDKLFAHIGSLSKMSALFPSLSNALLKSRPVKQLLERIGIGRELPPLAESRFSQWFNHYKQPPSDKQVVLFNDTFTEFYHPHIGRAAIKILNALGYFVIVPKWQCCGRPMISKGFLREAKKQAEKIIKTLQPLSHLPIVGLEPSCILTLIDDFPNLAETHLVERACLTLDEFLQRHIKYGELPLPWNEEAVNVKVHGHCHQKALVGMQPTLEVLKAIPGLSAAEIPSGCCGMAGSFGYEIEHISLSKQIGELHLLKEVRKAAPKTLILANGFSCRSQIALETITNGLHLAEIILKKGKL